MTAPRWDLRIGRALELAKAHSTAAEILRFYAEIARVQKSIYEKAPQQTDALLPEFPALLALVQRASPAPLADTARELAQSSAHWPALLMDPSAEPEHAFFARVLLQPYFEYQASQRVIPTGTARDTCPFCGELPVAAALRGEGEGGKRSLICSLCATEWDFRRLLCPHCGEEAEHKLPVYVTEEFRHVRVEACDTCRTYIKSVDLTKNGLAVPVVDELATVALNLWAEEHEYTKLQLNLFGM